MSFQVVILMPFAIHLHLNVSPHPRLSGFFPHTSDRLRPHSSTLSTGDSITVAPAQTLTDKEYQRLRDAAVAIIREMGVECGGSNVQMSINPDDGDMIIIEMNPRVSRWEREERLRIPGGHVSLEINGGDISLGRKRNRSLV